MQWHMGLTETVEILRMPPLFEVRRPPNPLPSAPERAKSRTHSATFSSQ